VSNGLRSFSQLADPPAAHPPPPMNTSSWQAGGLRVVRGRCHVGPGASISRAFATDGGSISAASGGRRDHPSCIPERRPDARDDLESQARALCETVRFAVTESAALFSFSSWQRGRGVVVSPEPPSVSSLRASGQIDTRESSSMADARSYVRRSTN
jgi:hypothetical protein